MNIRIGDIVEMKKAHPCGKKESRQFDVLRIGIDFKLRCRGCGHEMMLPRTKAEKNIKKILSAETAEPLPSEKQAH